MNPFSFALGMSNPFTASLTMGQAASDTIAPGGNFSPGRALLGIGTLAGAGALAYKYRSPLGAFAKQGLGYIDELLGKNAAPAAARKMASARPTGRAKVPFAKYAAALEEYPVTKATPMGPRTINPGYWRTSARFDTPKWGKATDHIVGDIKMHHVRAENHLNTAKRALGQMGPAGGGLQWGGPMSNGRSSVQKLDLRGIVAKGRQVRTESRFQALARTGSGRVSRSKNASFLRRALFRSAVSQQARVKKGKVY